MTDELIDRRDNKRRAEDAMAFQLMTETRQMVKEIEEAMEAKFDAISTELHQHRQSSAKDRSELANRLEHMSTSTINALHEQSVLIKEIQKTLHSAFADGDPEKHRQKHEAWEEEQKANKEFWLDVKKKAVGSIVTGVIIWAGIVLWSAFLNGPKP